MVLSPTLHWHASARELYERSVRPHQKMSIVFSCLVEDEWQALDRWRDYVALYHV
jgi:hypothetical protein